MVDREESLRRLTLGDEAHLERLIDARRTTHHHGQLDAAQAALVRLGALAASGGPEQAFQRTVSAALDAGVSPDQIVDALVCIAPVVGSTRVTAAAPKVAVAIGYDVESGLGLR